MNVNYLFVGSPKSGMEITINLLNQDSSLQSPKKLPSGILMSEEGPDFDKLVSTGFYVKGGELNNSSHKENYESGIRIVLFLRNPVERAFEQFKDSEEGKNNIMSFLEAIKLDASPLKVNGNIFEDRALLEYEKKYREQYIQKSSYYNLVKYFYDRIPRDQIKIVRFENIRLKPRETISSIKQFIGIESELSNPENLKKNIIQKRIRAIKGYFNVRRPQLKKADAIYLYYTYFNKDINKLEELTGIDFSAWKRNVKTNSKLYV